LRLTGFFTSFFTYYDKDDSTPVPLMMVK